MIVKALEERWQLLLAKLQAIAPLLATQGTLAPKTGRATLNWCVRYLDPPDREGKRVRKMIYIGSDAELLRRAGEHMELCRSRHLEAKEAMNLARVASTLGSQVRRQMQHWM